MRLLLDTHVLLWFISEDEQLRPRYCEALLDMDNSVWVSPVSLWEVILKWQRGGIPFERNPYDVLTEAARHYGFSSLAFDEASAAVLPSLPDLHRDPFDRMLVCQALAHGLTLVTDDAKVRRYAVPLL